MTRLIWHHRPNVESDTIFVIEALMKTLTYIVVCLGMLTTTALASDEVAERKANFRQMPAQCVRWATNGKDDFAGIGAGANAIASRGGQNDQLFSEGSESLGARNEIWSDFETLQPLPENQDAALAIATLQTPKTKPLSSKLSRH